MYSVKRMAGHNDWLIGPLSIHSSRPEYAVYKAGTHSVVVHGLTYLKREEGVGRVTK